MELLLDAHPAAASTPCPAVASSPHFNKRRWPLLVGIDSAPNAAWLTADTDAALHMLLLSFPAAALGASSELPEDRERGAAPETAPDGHSSPLFTACSMGFARCWDDAGDDFGPSRCTRLSPSAPGSNFDYR